MTATVLDPASGSRMFYFDKEDDRVLYGDIRDESHTLVDGRALEIHPDVQMDFRDLPFPDGIFRVVIFLALTPEKPLIGHRSGKTARTHWVTFLKPAAAVPSFTGGTP